MRNVAVAVLRQLGFPGTEVAAVLGLTPNYVATLHQRALREGTAGLVRPAGGPGRPARRRGSGRGQWRAAGVRDAEIARRLGVNQSTVLRRLGPAHVQDPLPLGTPEPAGCGRAEAGGTAEAGTGSRPGRGAGASAGAGAAAGAGRRPCAGRRAVRAPGMRGRCCCTRSRRGPGPGTIFRAAAGQDAAPQDVALLAAVSTCFALGAATTEQFKHLAAAEAGPLAGLARLPGAADAAARAGRDRRPRPTRWSCSGMFAAAMLAADPVTSGVYYVDDHFVPYTGAKPVAKGWNNKRGRAERGRADTHVTAHDGRAVCFVTGEPSGLTVTLPKALAELKKAAGPGAKIMLGFDRGGAYPQVFTHCREQKRALGHLPAGAAGRPRHAARSSPRSPSAAGPGTIAWAEEKVQLKDYGDARQITLFEHGRVVLQILTSDFDACPADILSWLKSRWREENFLKYASENYGIDKICDYAAAIETNTKITAQPGPQDQANAAVRDAEKDLAAAERGLAVLLADPAITPAAKNAGDPRRRARDHRAPAHAAGRRRRGPRRRSPRNCPPTRSTPTRRTALLRTGRRGLQMVLRLLAHNAEHWLSDQPQRLPARRRRIPRHHPRDHHPRPRRNHHLRPRRDHRHPPAARRAPRRPRPGPAHRRDQRRPARHPRRHPAHHLPDCPVPLNLSHGQAVDLGWLSVSGRAFGRLRALAAG